MTCDLLYSVQCDIIVLSKIIVLLCPSKCVIPHGSYSFSWLTFPGNSAFSCSYQLNYVEKICVWVWSYLCCLIEFLKILFWLLKSYFLASTFLQRLYVYKFKFLLDWSLWSQWSKCNVTCGGGARTRYRTCMRNNIQRADVSNCVGDVMDRGSCGTPSCDEGM